MNRIIFTILIALGTPFIVCSQPPEKMSYQAAIRDAENNLVTNTPVGMQVSIIQGAADGVVVYSETHTPATSANGLASVEVGAGSVVSGSFSEIDWSKGTFFIKVETDITGGDNYTITGISQLLSVPYAFYAGKISLFKNGTYWEFYISDNGNLMALPKITVEYPFAGEPTVTDIDDNIYNTVKIGTQVWMAENLKTTRFNHGDNIPLVTDKTEWSLLSTPAFCWYNNEETHKETYGALYNWFAAKTGFLCPEGWHVPTDAEWAVLTDYLGAMAGGRMKETGTAHWNAPNTDATNESGFTALPGSLRDYDGIFSGLRSYAHWWSSTGHNSIYAYSRAVNYLQNTVWRQTPYRQRGCSVRCVRDPL